MTVTGEIKNDGVRMRWVRGIATTITGVAAAIVLIWQVLVFSYGDNFAAWETGIVNRATSAFADTVKELETQNARTQEQSEELAEVVAELRVAVGELRTQLETDGRPGWQFDNSLSQIGDGTIGGNVQISVSGYKLRECGVPIVDLYFVGFDGVYHRFANVSLLSLTGRGIALPADPTRLQEINYNAQIPDDDGVLPGRASGFISVRYPDACPAANPAVGGPYQFRILPER